MSVDLYALAEKLHEEGTVSGDIETIMFDLKTDYEQAAEINEILQKIEEEEEKEEAEEETEEDE